MKWSDLCQMTPNPSWLKTSNDVQLCFLLRFWSATDKIWINRSLSESRKYPTAQLAIDALAAAYYGKRFRQPRIVKQANINYGRALAALHCALLESDGSCSFNVLAACTALQRYETIIYTTSTGWIQHAGGIARAIEVAGPKCFRFDPNKAILDANRYNIILEAHHRRRRTFLADEDWRELRTHDNDQDAHFDALQDLYARLTELAESVTSYTADPVIWRYYEITQMANSLLVDLDLWITHWITAFDFRPVERYVTSTHAGVYNDAEGPVFQWYLHYPSQIAGVAANLYRTLKLCVLNWQYTIQHPSRAVGGSVEERNDNSVVRQLALDICLTLQSYYSEDGQEVRWIWYLFFCSVKAHNCLPRQSREARWIATKLLDLGDKYGVELARNLTEFRLMGSDSGQLDSE